MNRKLLALLAALTLVLTACAVSDTAEAGGTAEGIQVHGHWTIDIYNEDGTLNQHHEFENDLVEDGAKILGLILSRSSTVGRWIVALDSFGFDRPCETSDGRDFPCRVVEPDYEGQDNSFFHNLKVEASGAFLILSGNATAAFSSTIERVRTSIQTCAPTTLPEDCTLGFSNTFSQTDPGSFPVEPGQQIQVTVEFSFS